LQKKPQTQSQWKRTVFFSPIVLAQPGDISAWRCDDGPGKTLASGVETPAAYAPCTVLFHRGRTKEICLKKQKKSDSSWRRAQEVEICHQRGKGTKREIMARSPDTAFSWQEMSACASQITSLRK